MIGPLPELVFLTVSPRKQGCQLLSKYLLPAGFVVNGNRRINDVLDVISGAGVA
jgi:hypothetical protein